MTAASLRGRLLVATPVIGDPNFDRTVVLVLEHGDDGAVGLVLNRPTDLDVVDPLPAWSPLTAVPRVVFAGGPVEPERAIALGLAAEGAVAGDWEGLAGGVGTVDLSRPPEDAEEALVGVRVFSGYAGWGPLQLEGELEVGAWFVVDAEPTDVLSADPDHLWSEVLARQPGRVAMFALCPPDPSMN